MAAAAALGSKAMAPTSSRAAALHLPPGPRRSCRASAVQSSQRSSSPQPRAPPAPGTSPRNAQSLDRLFLQPSTFMHLDTAARPQPLAPLQPPTPTPSPLDAPRDSTHSSSSTSGRGSPTANRHALLPGNVHVFCYGTNMNISTLHGRDVHKVVSRDAATVHDPNMRLVFKHHGGCATLATLLPGQVPKFRPFGEKVHGVLYQLSREDLKKLQKKDAGYQLTRLQVDLYDGGQLEAFAFVSSPHSTLAVEVAPTESYMRLLRQGASDNYLDPDYQAFLSSIETVTSAGLPADYYNTPAKHLRYGWVALAITLVAAALVALQR